MVMIGWVGSGDGVTVTGINVDVGAGVSEAVVGSLSNVAGWLPQDIRNTNKILKE
jgi:hypothetical protein